jgi:hypothetical protein
MCDDEQIAFCRAEIVRLRKIQPEDPISLPFPIASATANQLDRLRSLALISQTVFQGETVSVSLPCILDSITCCTHPLPSRKEILGRILV